MDSDELTKSFYIQKEDKLEKRQMKIKRDKIRRNNERSMKRRIMSWKCLSMYKKKKGAVCDLR